MKEMDAVPSSIIVTSDPAKKKAPPAVATPSPGSSVTTSFLSSPSDEKNTPGDIPPVPQASVPQAPVKNLRKEMKQEIMNSSTPFVTKSLRLLSSPYTIV